MRGQKKDKKTPSYFELMEHPTRNYRKINMIIQKMLSKIRNGYLYKRNSYNKIEIQLYYYGYHLSYVHIS